MQPTFNILALDPAMCTGFAHTNGQYGVWELGRGGAEHHGNRLIRFRDYLLEAAGKWGCDKIAFEDASFGSRNPAVQALHNELRGTIKLVAAELNVPFVGYKPSSIKKFATNYGFAKKDQMIRAAETMLGIRTQSSDVADACFILAMAQQEWQAEERRKARPAPPKVKERRLFR